MAVLLHPMAIQLHINQIFVKQLIELYFVEMKCHAVHLGSHSLCPWKSSGMLIYNPFRSYQNPNPMDCHAPHLGSRSLCP